MSDVARARRRDVLGAAAVTLYSLAGTALTPFAPHFLARRQARGKEDAVRVGERLGHASAPRPGGFLVWVHAASVGEMLAVVGLAERLTERGVTVLLTTGTTTSAEIAAKRSGSRAIHQFAPLDLPGPVARFLDHWRPDLALFVESELWPGMFRALKRRSVPLVLVNARMSERSFRGWRRAAPVAAAVLAHVDLALAQGEVDAEHLRRLGAPRVAVSGNLKLDAEPPPADEHTLAALRASIGARPVVVSASTHPGEETLAIAAHRVMAADGVPLLTIIAPRHPERGMEIEAEAAKVGLAVRRRSRDEAIDASTALYLADTIGEMGLWYRLADVVVIGGSLVPHGGQNPIEAAKLGAPVLHGPHVGNFRDIYALLDAAEAAVRVEDASAFASALARLVGDAAERVRLARAAEACIARSTGALQRTLQALEPFLRPAAERAAVR